MSKYFCSETMEYRGNEDKKERHSKNTERIFNQQTSSKELLKEVSQAAGKWYQMETGYIISEAESVDTANTE